ncbi:MAG TPA: DNA replication protein [Thioploca sp.]|nr:DNA replication protein [Thioploca sp.]
MSNYIYPSIYNKYAELNLHSTPKIKRKYLPDSDEYKYYFKLLNHIKKCGIVRFETKLKSRLLSYLNQQLYGRIDMKILRETHEELLNVPNKLQVSKFDLMTISEQLLVAGLCPTVRSANTTAFYAVRWSHGEQFDLSKSQVQHHRCILRKIGIDLALPCDPSKFTYIKQTSESVIELSDFVAPSFYQKVNRNFTITKSLH